MREKLIQYVDLLFAGKPDAEEIKQEILQNTLDRYDDLIDQGKSPEAAYSLSIAGIGDIEDIINHENPTAPSSSPAAVTSNHRNSSRLSTAIAIALFILCPIPVMLLQDTVGVCLLFVMIAAGVCLLIMNGPSEKTASKTSRSTLHKILLGIAWGCGISLYIFISILTEAWYITWLVFPVTVCTCCVINAIFDLNKNFLRAVVRIVVFGILILVLTVCFLGGLLAASGLSHIDEHYEVVNGNTESTGAVSAQQIRNIKVQWVSGSITVQRGDVQDIQFFEDSGLKTEHKMVWKQDGDQLTIQYCKPAVQISIFGNVDIPAKNLTITVPKDWLCGTLNIDSVSAKISIDQLDVTDADIVNVSGICKINASNFRDLDIETVSGNIYFDGQASALDMTSVSAECTAKLSAKPQEVDLETVSGDMILILPEDCGFRLDLDNVSGELISEFPAVIQNKHYMFGDGRLEISAETVSGDIFIKLPN